MNIQSANLGKRIVAFLIDSAILGVVFSILMGVAVALDDEVLILLFGVICECIWVLYFTLCEGSNMQASLGKQAMKIRVVNGSGADVSYLTAFLRTICFQISSFVVIGHAIALFTENNRTLHDMMTGTVVAEKEYQPNAAPAPFVSFGGQGARLIGLVGVYAGRSFPIGGGLIIGTDPTVCQVVIPAGRSGVSRNHCKVTFDAQSRMFIIHDLGSTNGTFLENGQRIPQGVPYAIHPGTKFYLAGQGTYFEVRN